MMRFAASPHERADAIAALTLVRALTQHLIESNRLDPLELELIRENALEELETGGGPIVERARELIAKEFP
jgi:hypothetical protein